MEEWSKLNKNKKYLMNVSNFWDIKIKRKSSMQLSADIINKYNNISILDIGANNRIFKTYLKKSINYNSFDIDKNNYHDYYNLEDINKKYDIIVMFACIEHINKDDFIKKYLKKIKHILKKNGKIIISTNNIFHNLGIRTDLTHVQAYHPRDLNSILINNGFYSGVCYRVTNINLIFTKLYNFISKYILRPYYIDFIPEVILINKKR